MTSNLANWTPRRPPSTAPIEGRLVRLEKLDPARHGEGLSAALQVPDIEERFRYLFDRVPADRAELDAWMAGAAAGEDPLFFAVVDLASGLAAGRQAFMRIDRTHGVIEIGSIYWGPAIARRPAATEALYLFARHAFDDLGYRRFEWKCDAQNAPSRRAAARFGFTFEGIFRQHMVVKGRNRDTAWFSMTDAEWPAIRAGFEQWLDPSNFDGQGAQKQRLEALRERASAAE